MKKYVLYLVGCTASIAALCGCGGINKLISSGKPDQIYDKGLEMYEAGKWNKAISLFESIAPYYSSTTRADTLSFYIARSHYKNRDFDGAASLLDEYRRTFGRSPFIEDAEGMYAMCFYHMSPVPERDQSVTTQAIIAVTEFMSRYPESPRREAFQEILQELTQRLHDKAYLNAYTYYKIGKHKSAIVALKNALKLYPESSHREELMFLVVASGYQLAHNSIQKLQTDRYLSMLDSYYTFIAEYPASKHRKEADRMSEEAKDFLAKHKTENNDTEENETTGYGN